MNKTQNIVGTVSFDIDIYEDFVSDIIIGALDNPYGGSRYWVDNVKVKSNGAKDILDEVFFSATFDDSYADHPTHYFVDADKIVKAIQTILSNTLTISSSIYDMLAKAVRENDAGYIDADVADVVLQVAVLGEIVYG